MRAYLQNPGLGLMAIVIAALVMTGSAAALDPALQDGLVANWSFDGNVLDNKGGANGTLVDGTYVPGFLGAGALSFDGVDDGVTIGTPASLDLGTNACTISAWVKLGLVPSAVVGSTTNYDYTGIFDSVLDGYVMYVDRPNNEIRFKATSADATNVAVGAGRPGVADPTKFDTTNWHHVVGTYDGLFLKCYYDGVLMDTLGISKNGGVQVLSGQVAGIGYQPGVTGTTTRGWLNGQVDEVAVWNRAINPDEITYLFNGGTGRTVLSSNPTYPPPAPPAMPNPIVHLTMDGSLTNTGTGGIAKNGTLVEGSAAGPDTGYVAGKIGQGLYLDNNGNGHFINGGYVSVPITLNSEEGTISFWCKPDGPWFASMGLFDNSSNGDDWEMWVDGSGIVQWRTEASSNRNNTYDLDTAGGPGNWMHITAVWRKSTGAMKAGVELYVNGELASGGDGPLIAPGTTFYLGGGNDINEYTVGAFDDLRIFDKALTPDQIREVYEIPEPSALVLLVSALLAFGIRGRKTV